MTLILKKDKITGDIWVRQGRIPSRLIKGPADLQAIEEGCWYSEPLANHCVQFFNRFLCHSKGDWAGKAFALLDWQEWEIIRPLFGWVRKNGTRRFRRAYVEVPKKNGKSTISSGIALYLLKADGEMGAEVYSAAADREQASIVFKEAANMVQSSPALSQMLEVAVSRRTMYDPFTKSTYKALSADVPTKEGLNIHGLIFDELHAQKTPVLWDTLKYGGASRRQPLFVSITTAGSDRNSICYNQHLYGKGVINGTINDTAFYSYIAAADEDDDWMDPKTWRKANPSFGITIMEDQFKTDFEEAKQNVLSQNSFRRYRLNQWTQQETRWLDMQQWRACPKVAPKSLTKKSQFFGGLDMSSVNDLTVFVQLFYEPELYVKCHYFIPEAQLAKRVQRDRVPYDVWARQGHLTITRGNTIDQDAIVERITQCCQDNKHKEIAYDRWNASHVITRCTDEGLTMVPLGQGFASLNAPSKELEKLIIGGKLNHAGHPILEWNANNCAAETDAAGNIKPSKKLSRERIDGVVALIMALARHTVHLKPKRSVYESRGVVALTKDKS